jgi:hypothetical protein
MEVLWTGSAACYYCDDAVYVEERGGGEVGAHLEVVVLLWGATICS